VKKQGKRILIPMWGEPSTTAYISFQPTETCAKTPVSPSRVRVIKDNSTLNYSIVFLIDLDGTM